MFCRRCGTELPDDSQFCVTCGAGVIAPNATSMSPAGAAVAVAPTLGPRVLANNPDKSIAVAAEPRTGEPRSVGVIPAVDLLSQGKTDTHTRPETFPLEQTKLVNEGERKANKVGASRWARLAIFLSLALAAAVIAALVLAKRNPTSGGDLAEKLTTFFLKLGLAAWGVSEVVAGRWLTLKRTWIAAIALFSIAFVWTAVFLGKPVSSKLADLNDQQAQLDRQFAESATGKTLLQPASFASPQTAADSLAEFEQYASATERLDEQKEVSRAPGRRTALSSKRSCSPHRSVSST